MDDISQSTLPENCRDAVNELYKTEVENTTEKRLRSAFRTPYAMSDGELKLLQSFYKNKIVTFVNDEKTRLIDSQHPVLASLNHFSNIDAQNSINSMRNKGWTTITIGDSFKKKNLGADHNCNMCRDQRDQYRAISNIFSYDKNSHNAERLVSQTFNGLLDKGCMDGAQHCTFEADVAYFMHSMYNLTPATVAEIFVKHKLTKAYSYILFPFTFLDKNLAFMDKTVFEIIQHKEKSIFKFNDFSIPYVHDNNNWVRWMNLTKIKTRDFHIVLEIVRQYGPLFIIEMVKVNKNNDVIYRNIPVSKIAGEFVLIPDIIAAFQNDFNNNQNDIPHLIIPENVAQSAFGYIARVRDEGLKYVEVVAMLQGCLRELRIGTVTYSKRWDTDPVGFHRAAISMFIIGACMRAERTTVISRAFKIMSTKGWLYDVWRYITHLWTEIFATAPISYKCLVMNSYKIRNYQIRYFQDRIVKEEINVVVYDTIKCYPEDDECIEFNQVLEAESMPLQKAECQEDVINHMVIIDTMNINTDVELDIDLIDFSDDAFEIDDQIRAILPDVFTNTKDASTQTERILDNLVLKTASTECTESCTSHVITNSFTCEQQQAIHDHVKTVKFVDVEDNEKPRECLKVASKVIQTNDSNAIPVVASEKRRGTIKHRPNYPRGQCFLQAVADNSSMGNFSPDEVYQLVSEHFEEKYHVSRVTKLNVERYNKFRKTEQSTPANAFDIVAYLYLAIWQENPATLMIEQAIAEIFDLTIEIDTSSKTFVIGNGAEKIRIYLQDQHYTSRPGGGDKTKFPHLMSKLITGDGRFIELSAAPGANFQQMTTTYKNEMWFAYYIDGIQPSKELKEYKNNIPYHNIIELKETDWKFDYIFSDVARKFNSERLIDDAIDVISDIIADGGNACIKTFANPWALWELSTKFEKYETINGVGTEVYYFLYNYGAGKIKWDFIVESERLDETTHCVPYDYKTMCKYRNELHRDIKIGQDVPFKNLNIDKIEFKAITGYAGASKTNTAVLKYPDALYIAPSKKLKEELQLKHNVVAYTPHIALKNIHKYNTIVIDEISTFSIHYLMLIKSINNKADIIVLGDKYQTGVISNDFTKNVFDFGVDNNMYVTYTIPIDVTKCLNDKLGTHIVTKSDKTNSFYNLKCSLKDFYKIESQILCFNDSTAIELRDKGMLVNTVTTFQGSRCDNVILYINDEAVTTNMVNSAQFVYTAVTRGTGKIVTYGNSNTIEKYLNIHGHTITALEEITGVRALTDTITQELKPNMLKMFTTEVADDTPSEKLTITYLEKALKPVNSEHNYHYMCDPNPKNAGGGILKTTIDQLRPPEKESKLFQFKRNIDLIRSQVSDDSSITVDTMLKRYTKRSKRLRPVSEKYATDAVLRGLSKAVYGNDHSLYKLQRDLKCDESEIRHHYVEYMTRLSKKQIGGQTQVIWEELGQPMDFYDEVLRFVNKRQGKYDDSDGFDSKLKAGQGVAAMSKKINIIFSCYASLLLDKMRDIAKRNKRNIIFATHGSDAEISELVAQMENQTKGNFLYGCNDFTEWDASFLTMLTKVTRQLVIWLGCPVFLIEWFTQFRYSWLMININKHGSTNLRGTQKQFSGSPFTICENTLCNVGLCYAIFDIQNEQYSIFKGDDSMIKCTNMHLSDQGAKMIKTTDHKLKLHCTKVGEFAGYIITSEGLFPDLLRKGAKFFGKYYRDQKHFEEAKESAFACTQVVNSQQHLEEGLIKSEYFYNGKLNASELRVIYHTLANAHKYKMSDLEIVNKGPFTPNMYYYKLQARD